MKKRYAVLCLMAFYYSSAIAQRVEKMDFQLRYFLAKDHPADQMVDLFIHGDRQAVSEAVRAVGGHVKLSLPQLVSARVPVAHVGELSNAPAVQRFEFSLDKGELMNDSMRVKSRVDLVHQGLSPLPQGYDGTGVVMGFIDSGLDLTHPDFRDAEGNTRVIRYWDQVPGPGSASPLPFGYGAEWTQQQLDAGGPIPVEPVSLNGHGTTVMGTGVGNGLANGRHKGVAPGADIVVVATNFGMPNWRSTVADGVAYILAVAESEGKPAVINASLGTYLGSHDGLDAAALLIDDMLEAQGGRVMVAASGNSHSQIPYHMQRTVTADTAFTWFQYNASSGLGFGAVFFELWADQDDFDDVRFAIGADRQFPSVAYRGRTDFRSVEDLLGQTVVDTLRSPTGDRIGVVQYFAAERGDQYQMQVLLQQPDSSTYRFRFMTTGSGKFDVWSGAQFGTSTMTAAPPPLSLPGAANYVLPDRNKHLVDSWACLSNVLTVANYCNETSYTDWAGNPQVVEGVEGNISVNSSAGPTRDERLKPDVAAPGDITFTAGPLDIIQWIIDNQNGWKIDPGGMHTRNGGTSMASPVVAGTAALFLQKCPGATAREVIAAIHASAVSDTFTGSVPNNRWGMGKLDAFAMMLNRAELIAESTIFCEGEGVEVTIPQPFTSVVWSNGSTSDPLIVSEAGTLSALLTTASGCTTQSDTITFLTLPLPPVPLVSQDGNVLASTPSVAYQWYLDGAPLEGATAQTWEATAAGDYTVETFGANGCSTLSPPVVVLTVGAHEQGVSSFAVWPNPARNELSLRLPAHSGGAEITLVSADGKVVFTSTTNTTDLHIIPLEGLASGPYTVRVVSSNEHRSARFMKLP